ncbi:MAG: PA14 domain-containing protein, partial [Candidatus Nanohalobium sp.]
MGSRKIKVFLALMVFASFLPLGASTSQVNVLLVADGHRLGQDAKINYQDDMFVNRYKSSLEKISGVNVDVYETNKSDNTDPNNGQYNSNETGPSADKMSKYDAVVWYALADYATGKTYRPLYDKDRSNIKKYLESGGSIYLSGHLIHNDISGTGLMNNYLKAKVGEGNGPSYWRYAGSKLQQGLRYVWYYADRDSPSNRQEMDKFFDRKKENVVLNGRGVHKDPVSWGTDRYGSKPSYLNSDHYSWKASGFLYAPKSGVYHVGLDSDDASDVLIDGENVVNWYGEHSSSGHYSQHSGRVKLDKGLHKIAIRMQDTTGDDDISVAWKKPGQNSFRTIPGHNFYFATGRKYQKIRALGYDKGEMIFNDSGAIKLKGKVGDSVTGQTYNFGLNTSIETRKAFGVISDVCKDEAANSFRPKIDPNCIDAADSLRWKNNLSFSGAEGSYISLVNDKRIKGDFQRKTISERLRVPQAQDRVLIVGYASSDNVKRISYGGKNLQELKSVSSTSTKGETGIYYLKNPDPGVGKVQIESQSGQESVSASAMVFAGVNTTNPIGDVAKDQGKNVKTQISSKKGDKVLDFVGAQTFYSPGNHQKKLLESGYY